MKIKCACKKYETDLPYIETPESNATRIKRYRAIKHDVNKCKAITGDEWMSENIKDIQDESIDIEQVFEPEDCTMYNENYGICQNDYPCDDCVERFKNRDDIKELLGE